MHSRSHITRRVSLLLASLMVVVINSVGHAQATSYKASFNQNKEAVAVNVLVGQSRVINFDKPVGRFSVSNPEIAEAILVSPDQVLVNGKAFGQVNFIAWEQSGGEYLVFDVYVRANLSLIDSQIRALFPKDDIRLSQANGSVVISGNVTDPKTAAQVDSVVQAAGFKTVNMLASPVKNMAQVQLQVRVAEVSRNRGKELGSSFATVKGGTSVFNSENGPANLTSFIGGAFEAAFTGANLAIFNNTLGTQAIIHALQTQGALRMLAEPNLIAMDGQQASFLAGGEFPIPIVQSSSDKPTITIVFKEYGVRLNFKPTIVDEDHIRLELEPEVSTIDFANGIKFDGFLVPALKTRRAKTGIELRDGQSFALAGLLDNSESRSLSKMPVLGDIPVLGALFKSKSFRKDETELMFIVTAQLVKPVNRDDLPQMRGIDGLKSGSPLGLEPKSEEIQGRTGFSVTGQNTEQTPDVAPKPAEPVKTVEPAVNPKAKSGTENGGTSSTGTSSNSTRINPTLPVALVMPTDFSPQPLKP
jgi:pilus assembly protein CpaC